MNDESSVIEQIIEIAEDDSLYKSLQTDQIKESNNDLYNQAISHFGSWELALIHSLHSLSQNASSGRRKRSEEGVVERRITDAFSYPVYISTQQHKLYAEPGSELEITEHLVDIEGANEERIPNKLIYIGQSDGLFLFSNRGRYFGMDSRIMPSWDIEALRSIREILFLEPGEGIDFLVSKRSMYDGRVIHLTRAGKGKATDVSDFNRDLDKTGRDAFLLNDDDKPCAVLVGPEQNSVLCASALGQAIHFDASDLRSMGRKAVGVNIMKLQDDTDEVVGGFLGKSVKHFAVITREGLGKRLELNEFRQQGRGGAGMQLLRLNINDRVAAITPCNLAEDIAILTNRGRMLRMPTTAFSLMGRSAKGNQIVTLDSNEFVIDMVALPCGSALTPSPLLNN